MVPHPARFDTAVFIDLENLLKGYALSAEQMARLDFRQLLAQIREREALVGQFAMARAYANWQTYKVAPLQRTFTDLGIAQEHVQAVSGTQKNLCDIAIATDVMDVLHSKPHLRTFVLVTGDGGFAWLVRRLHEYGKAVVVASYPAQMNEALRSLADAFIEIEDPTGLRQADYHSQDPAARALLDDLGRIYANRVAQAEVELFGRRLFARMPDLELPRKALEAGVPLGKLQTWVEEVMDGFRHEALGFTTFSEWVKQMAEGKQWELVLSGTEQRLCFRTQPLATPTLTQRVELGDAYKGKAQPLATPANPASSAAVPATLPEPPAKKASAKKGKDPLADALAKAQAVLEALDKELDFDQGELLEDVAKALEKRLPGCKPYALGLEGFEHLAKLAGQELELAEFAPQAKFDKPLMAYAGSKLRGYIRVEPIGPAEVHSQGHYKAALQQANLMQEGGGFMPYFRLHGPEMTRAVARQLYEHRDKRRSIDEWKALLEDKLKPEPELASLGSYLGHHVLHTVLAYQAAKCFDSQPKGSQVRDQTHMLDATSYYSANKLIEHLRATCADKIAKLIDTPAKEEILKSVVG